MRIQATLLRCVAAAALAFCVPAAASAEWRRIDSPNFIVIGDVGERQLRDVAMQFEGFRDTLARILVQGATATAVPTVVIVFPDDRALTPFKPLFKGKPVDVSGVFYGGRDVNYIALVADGRPGSMRVVFHEYAHLVVSNVARNIPAWLNEGLAEHYSTYEPRGRRAVIGAPIESHIRLLGERRLLPLADLLNVTHASSEYNEGDRRSIFYAQSWALTHMLLLGDPPRRDQLGAYLQQVARGVPQMDAWRAAFGDLQVERELEKYVRRFSMKAYLFEFPDKIARFEGAAGPMPQGDVQAILAGLYVRQQREPDAEKLLTAVLKDTPEHPMAAATMAQIETANGKEESALRRLQPIKESTDWFADYTVAVSLSEAIQRDVSAPEIVGAAIARFNAVAAKREVPNVLAHVARLELVGPNPRIVNGRTAIERARSLAPGRDDYAFIHAQVLGETGEFAAARAILGPLLSPLAPDHVRENARGLLAYLARREQWRPSRGSDTAAGATPPAGDTSRTPPGFVAIYRTVEKGEERLEGVLERIDCRPGSDVIFQLRMGGTLTPLAARRFEDVEFITYRDDLSGNIGCGPLKPPLPVYATLRALGTPPARVVVAIEFLPKR
jgi:tetratricopeptide (TPR) repeat protein